MSNELGIDRSGNNNTWTVNNMTLAADQMLDSPTNNFCTMNPLDKETNATLSEGNLKARSGSTGVSNDARGTMQLHGKVYYEVMVGAVAGDIGLNFGFCSAEGSIGSLAASSRNGFYYNSSDMRKFVDGSVSVISSGAASAGDVIGLAINMDDGEFSIFKNNTAILSDQAFTNNYNMIPLCQIYRNDGTDAGWFFNFGQDSSFAGSKTAQGNQDGNSIGDFYYTPPTGYLALCTSNLPAVAVTPSEHFNTVLYTGNGSTNAVTGVGFQPDFTWLKVRDIADVHALFDSARGVNKRLYANATNAEMTGSNQLDSWGADGFTLGADGAEQVNMNTKSYVAWNWKANGSGSSNTDGSITSTVSANVDAGFSIVSYTGTGSNATVGHGLSSAPDMVIVKNRDAGDRGWFVYHSSNTANPETDYLYLNTTAATSDYDGAWNDTAPTNSLFSLGNSNEANSSDADLIAYCFHSVDGYSKFGSYTGNDATDGTFVYTSFAPALVILKYTSGSAGGTKNWHMYDNKRSTYNPTENVLFANETTAESGASAFDIDFLSNGFKLRNAEGAVNNAAEYIFIAFAETPFKYSTAR